MAIANRTDFANSGNFCLPAGVYSLSVKKVEMHVSKNSGGRSIMLLCEIIDPTSIKIGDTEINIAGKEHRYYLGLSTVANEKTGVAPVAGTLQFMENVGLGSQIDTEDPDLSIFENLKFRAVMEGTEQYLTGKDNKPIMENGKKVLRGYQIRSFPTDVIGVAS